ncbi:MAG: hypothetical protein HON04_11275 [Planctomicrobium sp.]|nr:hypothetical protein [Planctomicrobium sp.]
MNTVNPIVHGPPGGMPKKTYEYLLPVKKSEILPEHYLLLTEWFQRYLNLSSTEVRELLSSDWNGFKPTAAVNFRDYLLTLLPNSIVIDDNRVWLALRSESPDDSIMIHEPHILTKLETEFVQSFHVDSLEIFCTHFYEAYESTTPYDNALSMRPEPLTNHSFAKSGDWLNGMYLYYIASGDGIMMAPDGRIGRWSHDIASDDAPGYNRSNAVEVCAPSFEEFISQYIAYLKMDKDGRRGTMFW